MKENYSHKQLLSLPVLVAAMGYFVDIYDLLLFSIVRIPSLKGLHVPANQLLEKGVFLINIQMGGMLVGGIFWGIIGDKRGRLSVLFGSIALYSLANIANGFIVSVDQYAFFRFIAGIGLAGELGAGITLVAEMLPKAIRGYGTSIVAAIGLLGAVLAYLIADAVDWRIAYIIGGVMGFMLLGIRFKLFESGMFNSVKEKNVRRGNILVLFSSSQKFIKYLRCIVVGLPVWFVIGILFTFSPEFGKVMGMPVPIQAGKAVMYGFIGLSLGDISSGLLSQFMKSRRKVVFFFLILTSLTITLFLTQGSKNVFVFYRLCLFLGFSIGFWALFVTISAEQFGTNLRATVATTAPNFVRGSVNILGPLFLLGKGYWGVLPSAGAVGGFSVLLAFLAVWKMEETFHKDLNYLETE